MSKHTNSADVILLHAPSVYDFRKRASLYGPMSDVIPSGAMFEMYPIGFMTMAGYLQRHGMNVRIVNLALRMVQSKRFDAERFIARLRPPRAFGIDLHWLVHAQGALEVAGLLKKYHPTVPVILGGLSSSFFHQELISYPQIDFVIRGDSAEEPLRRLVEELAQEKSNFDSVPNLTWRALDGTTRVNELSHIPQTLDDIPFDYGTMVRSVFRHRDLLGHMPFNTWLTYPIVAILPWKGCVHDCVSCGGGNKYKRVCKRAEPAYRSPAMVVKNIEDASRLIHGPIMVLGDLRQAGQAYVEEFYERIGALRLRNELVIELFDAADRDYLERIATAVPRWNLEISPESHDVAVRRAFGRPYDNARLEQTIADALELGCQRIDLFFMTGLPKQSYRSVLETADYCGQLLHRFGKGYPGRVVPYLSPLAPFIDPGSRAFENPQKHGYRLFYKTFEEHRRALMAPSWKYMLSYETECMTRDEIVASTYDGARLLARHKHEAGLLNDRRYRRLVKRLDEAQAMVATIDAVLARTPEEGREKALQALAPRFGILNDSTIALKDELQWPFAFWRFNPLGFLKALLSTPSGRPGS